jgi:hypothetical protein
MIIFRDQDSGRSHNIKIDTNSLETAEVFKFRKKLAVDWSKGRLAIIPCKVFCLPPFLLKNITFKTWRIINFYGCENSSLTIREERRLSVFESRVLRGIFGPKRDEVIGQWENIIVWSLLVSIFHQTFSCEKIKNELGRSCGTYGWEERFIQGLVGNPKGREHLQDPEL